MGNVNIIITTIGANKQLLEECVASIDQFAGDETIFDITVVDDGWIPELEEWCHKSDLYYVRTGMPYSGYSKSANLAVSKLESSADNLLFIHDDIRFFEDTDLPAMCRVLDNHESIGLVSPKIVFPRKNLCSTFMLFKKRDQDGQYEMTKMFYQWYRNFPGANVQAFVPAVNSGCLLIKRKCFDEVGGFEQRYVPCFFEDIDLSLSVREKNYKILYMPRSEVIHHTGVSINPERLHLQTVGNASLQKFYEKWNNKTELFGAEPEKVDEVVA
jgi:GT2 family glycosyltransferase